MFRLPNKHPWSIWIAFPVAFALCTALVCLFVLVLLALGAFLVGRLPQMPDAETQWFMLRLVLAAGFVYSLLKLKEYYAEFKEPTE